MATTTPTATPVVVFLKPRPVTAQEKAAGLTSLFEVDGQSVTFYPPAPGEENLTIDADDSNAGAPARMGTPSKIPRTPARSRTLTRTPSKNSLTATAAADAATGVAGGSTPWKTPAKQQPRQFKFDAVFEPEVSLADLFAHVQQLVEMVVAGCNATLLAYGATGSGKTHSIMGTRAEEGLFARLVRSLFDKIQQASGFRFTVQFSFIEVYNNAVFDLLSYDAETKQCATLDVHDAKGRVTLTGSTTLRSEVHTIEEVLALLSHGQANRSVGCTNLNEHSSRSHAICTLDVTSRSVSGSGPVRSSRMHIVDLAGSERLAASGTGSDPKTLAETQAINLSLTALADVLSALSEPKRELWLVPYRNSKLTHLLKDSLGGSAKTIMLVHARTTAPHYRPTLTTLTYASRARHIRNMVTQHITTEAVQEQVLNLRHELREQQDRLREVTDQLHAAVEENRALQQVAAQQPKVDDGQIRLLQAQLKEARTASDAMLAAKLDDALNQAREARKAQMELEAREVAMTAEIQRRESEVAEMQTILDDYRQQLSEATEAAQEAVTADLVAHGADVAQLQALLLQHQKGERNAKLQLLSAYEMAERLVEQLDDACRRATLMKAEAREMRDQRDAVVQQFTDLVGRMESAESQYQLKLRKVYEATAAQFQSKVDLLEEELAAALSAHAAAALSSAESSLAAAEAQTAAVKAAVDQALAKAAATSAKELSTALDVVRAAHARELSDAKTDRRRAIEAAVAEARAKWEAEQQTALIKIAAAPAFSPVAAPAVAVPQEPVAPMTLQELDVEEEATPAAPVPKRKRASTTTSAKSRRLDTGKPTKRAAPLDAEGDDEGKQETAGAFGPSDRESDPFFGKTADISGIMEAASPAMSELVPMTIKPAAESKAALPPRAPAVFKVPPMLPAAAGPTGGGKRKLLSAAKAQATLLDFSMASNASTTSLFTSFTDPSFKIPKLKANAAVARIGKEN